MSKHNTRKKALSPNPIDSDSMFCVFDAKEKIPGLLGTLSIRTIKHPNTDSDTWKEATTKSSPLRISISAQPNQSQYCKSFVNVSGNSTHRGVIERALTRMEEDGPQQEATP
jgi:hypothetical protein